MYLHFHKWKCISWIIGKYDGSNTDNQYFYIDSYYEAVQFDKTKKNFTKYIKTDYLDRELDEQANIIKTKEETENNIQPKPRTKTQMDETILNQEEFEERKKKIMTNI